MLASARIPFTHRRAKIPPCFTSATSRPSRQTHSPPTGMHFPIRSSVSAPSCRAHAHVRKIQGVRESPGKEGLPAPGLDLMQYVQVGIVRPRENLEVGTSLYEPGNVLRLGRDLQPGKVEAESPRASGPHWGSGRAADVGFAGQLTVEHGPGAAPVPARNPVGVRPRTRGQPSRW